MSRYPGVHAFESLLEERDDTRVTVSRWQGEVCKRCNRRNCIGFDVTDTIWSRVTKGLFNVLCTTCFDELAEAEGVQYKFLSVWSVSWSDWESAA